MIYWLTGQPCAGKTVLGNKLKKYLDNENSSDIKRIDGDDLRELISNKDYSIKGRVYNVDIAQKLAHYLLNCGETVIVTLVSPYLDQREEFKTQLGESIKEIYVYTTESRERDHFHTEGYQKPKSNFLEIDTTLDNEDESLNKIINYIKNN
jgi:adenylylsulfate kinase-like enzyme